MKIFKFAVLTACGIHATNGFAVPPKHSKTLQVCFARPAPNANFDLEAILAAEKEMDKAVRNGPYQSLDALDDDDLDDDKEDEDDNNVHIHVVPEKLYGMRIDAVISALEPKLSRSLCGQLVTEGRVSVTTMDGTTEVCTRKAEKIVAGTTVQITLPIEETPTEITPQKLPLSILYEDDCMIVLNKAADMVVHPAAGNWDGTVVNALAYYLAHDSPYSSGDFLGADTDEVEDISIDGADGEAVSFRPGIVHRLDKGTTGVLVVAKTRATLAALSNSFKERKVQKTYLAMTVGNPGKRVVIDKPIGRHPIHRQRMRVVPDPHRKNSGGFAPKDRMVDMRTPSQAGRRSLSFVDSINFDGKLSLVQVRIETGRTHQIRVHLQDRHTPVYGDDVYGLSDWNKKLASTHQISRPLLHAYVLEIDHPISGERMQFRAPMADDMWRIAKASWPQGENERPDLFAL
jgi:23S rRNA pseudouridine1911/1915/1917 synthase